MFDSCRFFAAPFSLISTSDLASGEGMEGWSRAQTPRLQYEQGVMEKHGVDHLLFFLDSMLITGTNCPFGKDHES